MRRLCRASSLDSHTKPNATPIIPGQPAELIAATFRTLSGRSDMVALDIMHLKEKLYEGFLDVGIIIVPDNDLSKFLTDRTPNPATAVKHIGDRARDLPIRVIAFRHNGPGTALDKMRTNLGRHQDA